MSDILGPVAVIGFIFLLYYGADWLSARGQEKHIDQEMRLREADLLEKEIDLKTRIVDFETRRLGIRDEPIQLHSDVVDAEYKVLEDKREEK